MNTITIFGLLLLAVSLSSYPLGIYLHHVMEAEDSKLARVVAKLLGPAGKSGLSWSRYGISLLVMNVLAGIVVAVVLALQPHLPLNPDGRGALSFSLIVHTAVSFFTNTDQQHYSGEVSLSYFSQLALIWLQFISAATGIAALAALARGLVGKNHMGNPLRDTLRVLIGFLLPLTLVVAAGFVLSGMPMTFGGAETAHTLEGGTQVISRGPVAAFVAIKQLGTNGGGFFGTNSTHPFENPNIWSHLLSIFSLLLLPMSCVWMLGKSVGKMRFAGMIFAVMMVLLAIKVTITVLSEQAPSAGLAHLPTQVISNLEGKELRLGADSSAVWAALTTCSSNGSVSAMHDSLNPLSLLGPLFGMWLNATFGGAGVGMINCFLFIILTVFIAGLMIGRTPEFLSKKIEMREMALAASAFLVHPLLILGATALFSMCSLGTGMIQGAHGFCQMLYEFSSAAANNGSGMEGLVDSGPAWNYSCAALMFLGRYLPILIPLAMAASLARKPSIAESPGTLSTDSVIFGIMLFFVIVFLGALTFFPAALLGPILDHLI